MLLLIPHLFPPARLLEVATHNLRVPALETLLARGSLQTSSSEGTEAALCQALGIARQQDWPIAPITLEVDGQSTGDAYWLRADPVHLQVMRDRIVLSDGSALNLSLQESEALADTIGKHFGDALKPVPLHSQRWYVQLPHPPLLTTTTLSAATGHDIGPLQPRGADAQQFRTLLNELQMLLFTHPVNQAREVRGDLQVNSLWLWGGGIKPDATQAAMPLYANEHIACAIGAFCGAQVSPAPAKLEKSLLGKDNVILLNELACAGQSGDAYSWREAIDCMETNWFSPLLGSLKLIGSQGLKLQDPVNGKTLYLKWNDAWKVWRRPKKLLSITA